MIFHLLLRVMELILDKGSVAHRQRKGHANGSFVCSGCYHVAITLDNASSKAV